MNHFAQKTVNFLNSKYLFWFVTGLLCIHIFAYSITKFYDADSQMYFAMGKHFFKYGWDLFTDHLSIDFQGKPITPNPWLYTFIVGFIHEFLGGLWGLSCFKFLLLAFPFIYFAKELQKKEFNFPVKLTFLFGFTSMLLIRDQLRPEMISLIFTVIYSFSCFRIHQSKEIKKLDRLIAVLILWHQFHISYLMGVTMVGAVLIAFFTDAIGRRDWAALKPIVIRSIIVLLTSFIQPNPLDNPILQNFTVVNQFAPYIQEFDPSAVFQSHVQVIYWVVLLAIFALSIARKNLYAVIVIGIFAKKALQIPIVAPFLATTLVPIFIENFSWLWNKYGNRKSFVTITTVVSIFFLYFFGYAEYIRLTYQVPAKSYFTDKKFYSNLEMPYDVVQFMNNRNLSGIFLNDMSAGPYLALALNTPPKLFLDIRVGILYPFEYLHSYIQIRKDPTLMQSKAISSKADFIFSKNTEPFSFSENALYLNDFSLLYAGEGFTVFEKKTSQSLPLSTQLFFDAACIKNMKLDLLEAEQEIISKYEPRSVSMEDTLAVAIGYLKIKSQDSQSKQDWIQNPQINISSDAALRLYAYTLAQLGDYKKAIFYLSKVRTNQSIDFVDSTRYLLNLGLYDGARANLLKDKFIPWRLMEFPPNIEKIQALLLELKTHFPNDEEINVMLKRCELYLEKNQPLFKVRAGDFRSCRE